MNRVLVVVGVLLVSLGLLSLKYHHYSWQEDTTATISTPVVEFDLPAQKTRTIQVPPGISWGAAGLGWLLVFMGVAQPSGRSQARAHPASGPPGPPEEGPKRSPR